jgi:uncharacterized 2Fe-2S/4Fe-4S cluster protein (DUF4445 family)
VFSFRFGIGLFQELLHQRAGIIAKTLMLIDARIKSIFGIDMDLGTGTIMENLVFLHLKLSRLSHTFNLLWTSSSVFDKDQANRTKAVCA